MRYISASTEVLKIPPKGHSLWQRAPQSPINHPVGEEHAVDRDDLDLTVCGKQTNGLHLLIVDFATVFMDRCEDQSRHNSLPSGPPAGQPVNI